MRVFFDTNVLASALATRGLCAELFEVVLQSHELITSVHVLHELQRILPEKLGQSKELTQGFIALLREHTLLVAAKAPYPSLPDPDDEPIVAAAIAGQAAVFVTGDKALLQLQKIGHLPLVDPRQFWELLARK